MQRIANLRSSYRVRPRTFFFLVVSYFVWASVTLRWITEFIEQDHPLTLLVSALLLLYGLLLGLEPLITSGSATRVHLYLALQTTLVLAAILFHFELDFFALLLLPLCGQAIFLLPRTAAAIWVALLGAANIAGQLQQFGWPQGLPFMLLYSAGFVFVAAFSILILQAEQAHKRSEKLLAELREAHQKLQAFSVQAEELAIANERNRLARDLHDSVAQTLYGLTLQAEAANPAGNPAVNFRTQPPDLAGSRPGGRAEGPPGDRRKSQRYPDQDRFSTHGAFSDPDGNRTVPHCSGGAQ
ncbi:MAG: histidine kinase [Anaerolineales bacterium]